jgi:hypothetical protein
MNIEIGVKYVKNECSTIEWAAIIDAARELMFKQIEKAEALSTSGSPLLSSWDADLSMKTIELQWIDHDGEYETAIEIDESLETIERVTGSGWSLTNQEMDVVNLYIYKLTDVNV